MKHAIALSALALSALAHLPLPAVAGMTAQPTGAPASAPDGTRFRDDDVKYTLTLPAGWRAMEPAELRAVNEAVQRMAAGQKVQYEAGYVMLSAEGEMQAYMLLQKNRASLGRREIEGAVNAMLGVRGSADEQKIRDILKDVAQNFSFDQPSYDRSTGTVVMPTRVQGVDGSRERGLSFCRFGTEGMVLTHFYSNEADYERLAPQFKVIAQGGTFDPGHTFADAQARESAGGSRFVSYGVIGGVIGGLVAVLAMGKKKKDQAAAVPTAPAGGAPPKV